MLNDNNELWKPYPLFESRYKVSPEGKVLSLRLNKVMNTYLNNKGYVCIDLTDGNKVHKKLLHRIIAETFLPNPNELPEVNHIDEVKTNNAVENLEWCTRSHNKRHSMTSGTYDKIYTTKNSLGKKHLPNTTSTYHNVWWDKSRSKWTATIRSNGVNLERKRFDTEVEAALHVNYLIDKYSLYDRPKNTIV